jgi:hypothetical protein
LIENVYQKGKIRWQIHVLIKLKNLRHSERSEIKNRVSHKILNALYFEVSHLIIIENVMISYTIQLRRMSRKKLRRRNTNTNLDFILLYVGYECLAVEGVVGVPVNVQHMPNMNKDIN